VLCSKVTVIVNDQKKKHASDLDIQTVKVGDGDSAKKIKDAKLKSHGIIAKDKDGKLVTTVDGHSYGKEKVEEVIKKLLAKDDSKSKDKKEKKES
jgi:hypothetical protein